MTTLRPCKPVDLVDLGPIVVTDVIDNGGWLAITFHTRDGWFGFCDFKPPRKQARPPAPKAKALPKKRSPAAPKRLDS